MFSDLVKKSAPESPNNEPRIGEFLINKKLIKPDDVEQALEAQKTEGSRIGEVLVSQGKISMYNFYKEFAEFKNYDFINLDDISPDSSYFFEDVRDDYFERSYIPFGQDDGQIKIATSEPTDELLEYLDSKYKSYKLYVTSPYDLFWTLQKKYSELDTEKATNMLYVKNPEASSKSLVLDDFSKVIIIFAAVISLLLLKEQEVFFGFLTLINIFFFTTVFSKGLFFLKGYYVRKETKKPELTRRLDKELPIYSILVPLYKEKEVTISRLLKSLSNLNYPKSRLDIKLITEVEDFKTLETIKRLKPPSYFQIVRVPHSMPKTKPKACNYALRFCRGEFITIYDAEDCPDKDQLKKVLKVFEDKKNEIACVQAHLNYYNKNENLLTKLFSIEYTSWFEYTLYGLKNLNLVIPLGGTSNHFRLETLKELYAWDPYNVTEDADLGIRLALANKDIEIIASETSEEAPITVKAWINQRKRWIKGYIQTFLVHMRKPVKTFKKLGLEKTLGFIYFIAAPSIIFLSVPLIILFSAICILFGKGMPIFLIDLCMFNLFLGIIFHFAISLFVFLRHNEIKGVMAILAFPFYWVLHFYAAYGAVRELINMPHHWNKTEHGVSKQIA
jgi:cellulose synthase/poly-beta-1,6-N-acetylglucosamine synthase-like glycosyltransferase